MIPYLLVFVVALFYLVKAKRIKCDKYLILYFLYVALFVGLGDMIGGYDRYIYGDMFDSIAEEMRGGRNLSRLYYLINGKEYGYFFWQVIVSFVTQNRYIFILITTLTLYTLYFFSFKQYIQDYPLATIVFLGFFYYFTMTYLRQVFAVGIVWLSVRYIWERKPIKFFALVLLAYTFHDSALIFASMYFLPIRKYSPTAIFIFVIVCLLVSLSPLPSALLASSGEATGMAERTAAYTTEDQGFRIEYVLECVFLLWLIFTNYRKIVLTKQTLVFLNMTIVFCGILLLFMRFQQGGRFGWYFFLGIIYMLTHVCNLPNHKTWLKPLVITVCFLLFLRITYSWKPMNVPYKTFLTNGEPAGNGDIYQKFEYDYSYTVDKFYKK
ncbi:EpsG family protein [Hallella colorans]|uniref:EpsG family protein n=1 Tax=Hallella colorans TaxID=1703337 RepID=UPI002889E76A|nr:EpsG family protein [Hallella colorans]